jgi:spore coat polysaccharide biosynthesis protein SpsF
LNTRTGIIIQARTGSTRLPDKMVLPFYNEKGILEIVLNRLIYQYEGKYKIILATTENKKDDIITGIGEKLGISIFRGDENDVLQRFVYAANSFNLDNIIRVCADNPMLNTSHIAKLIEDGEKGNFDYLSYEYKNNLPIIKSHLGLYTEFVTLRALKKALELTGDMHYHEHVTNYIYENKAIFNVRLLDLPYQKLLNKNLRFTLDTKADFELLKKLYSDIGENNIEDIISLIEVVEQNSDMKIKMNEQIIENSK